MLDRKYDGHDQHVAIRPQRRRGLPQGACRRPRHARARRARRQRTRDQRDPGVARQRVRRFACRSPETARWSWRSPARPIVAAPPPREAWGPAHAVAPRARGLLIVGELTDEVGVEQPAAGTIVVTATLRSALGASTESVPLSAAVELAGLEFRLPDSVRPNGRAKPISRISICSSSSSTTRQRSIRNRLVERHMGLAAHIAKRFSRPGVADDDLRQVAMLGLGQGCRSLRSGVRRAVCGVCRQHDRG